LQSVIYINNPQVAAVSAIIREHLKRLGIEGPGAATHSYVGEVFFHINNWQATLGNESVEMRMGRWLDSPIITVLYYSDPDFFDKIAVAIGRAIAMGPQA